MDDEEYEMSDSDSDSSKPDVLLLENARNALAKQEISSDEEVYGFGDSENEESHETDEDDEEKDLDMGSDLEDKEKPTDDRAWGKKKRSFYSTDFVDQDYEGIYQGEEAEVAELEEQEAKNIQKRLVEQLNDADFSITETVDIAESAETIARQEMILSDLTQLTKRQKLDLIKKESPEFFLLVEDFKQKIQEAQKILPVMNFLKSRVATKSFTALEFLQTRLTVILNYCTNISYYLFLKAKRIPIKNHPILKSLFQYRKFLQQLDNINESVMQPFFDKILKKMETGKEIKINERVLQKKNTLKVLTKQKRKKMNDDEEKEKEELKSKENMEVNDEEELAEPTTNKRAITYEMAKNKGLLPKRSKEQRNPRVKHRKKYQKAKIRRRGQVRTPRAVIPKYEGEPTGIKIGLTKSIKIKY